MDMHFVVKRAILITCLLAMPALAGCQTVAGFGRDVQSTGRWISGGADRTQAWMFGPQNQAEAQATNGNMSGSTAMAPQKTMTPAARVPDARGNIVYFATGSADIPPDGIKEIQTIAMSSPNNSGQNSITTSAQNTSSTAAQSAGGGSGQNSGDNAAAGTRKFEVIGYTDTSGSAASNRELSKRRAEAVADALASRGVPRNSIDTQWHGEDQLPIPTADNVPEPQNRRVSIVVSGG